MASLLFSVFYGSLKNLKIAMNFNFCFRPTSKSLTELHHREGIKGGVHVLGKIFPLAPSPSPLLEESLSSTFTCRPFLSAQVGPPNFKNYPSRLFMLIFPRNQRGVNVARSGYSGSRREVVGSNLHCCAEVILKLPWGANNLSPGRWRFGSANKELLSNCLGGE